MAENIVKVRIFGDDGNGWSWDIICEGKVDIFSFNRSVLIGKTGYKTRSDAEFDANDALTIIQQAIERAFV